MKKKVLILTLLISISFTFQGNIIVSSLTTQMIEDISLNSSSGLVAYWSFNSSSGTEAVEPINEFNGLVSGANWIPGVYGNALDFDGEDDFVNITQSAISTLGTLDQGTIAFWFNYQYNLDSQEIQPLFYFGIEDEKETDNMLIIEVGHANSVNERLYVTWVVSGGIPICYDTGMNLQENAWYHFAVVVGPSGNTGYLNGTEIVSRHYNFGDADQTHFLSSISVQDQLTFGYGKTADGKSPNFLHFQGKIDEVCIYDRPLSGEEITELMEYGLTYSIPENETTIFLPFMFVLIPLVYLAERKRKDRTYKEKN